MTKKYKLMEKQTQVFIVGAGLAGSLIGIYLARRGYAVDIFESRPDMRSTDIQAGRSINLALSNRGIRALKKVGIDQQVLDKAVPMLGRMLHDQAGNLKFAPYGRDKTEYINSISRGELNKLLMTEAEKHKNVKLHFNQKCVDIDLHQARITLENQTGSQRTTPKADFIIGADGVNSAVRRAIVTQNASQTGDSTTVAYSRVEWLEHGYKELTIRPATGKSKFKMDKQSLHIWPRGTYMLIALPNFDGSFTCTLFFPMKGEISFEGLNRPEKIRAFFEREFRDTLPLIDNLEKEFAENPVGKLGTLRCAPWHYKNKAVLIGDAAHAIVPFYGQGMNASFEDCIYLDQCIEKHAPDWEEVFKNYEQLRYDNGQAIADLAVENFYEMRDHVANPIFRKKRTLEQLLEKKYEDYHSKYSLVTFHPEFSYSKAKELGNKQDALLMELCGALENIHTVNIEQTYQKLKALN